MKFDKFNEPRHAPTTTSIVRSLLNRIRVAWLEHEIARIRARIELDQAAVDGWPEHRGAWLQEISRLQGERDRVTGRGDRVNFLFGGRARQ